MASRRVAAIANTYFLANRIGNGIAAASSTRGHHVPGTVDANTRDELQDSLKIFPLAEDALFWAPAT